MKKAAKVFILIGTITCGWMIAPLIVGIIAFKKVNRAQKKSDLIAIGIVTLLLCSVIAGILMLCMRDSDLAENRAYINTEPQQIPDNNYYNNADNNYTENNNQ